MVDWEKILWAGLIGVMILMLIPQAQTMFERSTEAKPGDWMAVIVPLIFVIGFVVILIALVR